MENTNMINEVVEEVVETAAPAITETVVPEVVAEAAKAAPKAKKSHGKTFALAAGIAVLLAIKPAKAFVAKRKAKKHEAFVDAIRAGLQELGYTQSVTVVPATPETEVKEETKTNETPAAEEQKD